MTHRVLFKILTQADWAKVEAGQDVQSPIDITDGFVHFSTAEQVQDTLDKWFQGVEDALLVAFIDHDFPNTLKWEPAREGELFPHVYGRVAPRHIRGVWKMEIGPSGAPLAPKEALEFR